MKTKIGTLLRTAREKNGLSQTAAGKRLRLSGQFLNRIEAGVVPLPLTRAKKLKKLYGVTRTELLAAYLADYKGKVKKALTTTKRA